MDASSRAVKARSSPRTGAASIGVRRLAAQQIVAPRFSRPAALVAWMGAVQAQDPAAARWAVALRLDRPTTEGAVERALDQGQILRTHALRFTWQLVVPADVRWMISLVAPRLIARSATRHRQLGLAEPTFRRAGTALERALRGGAQLTRDELAETLEGAGISPAGQRLSHLLGRAELDQVICSGARRGKQATYALLDDRAPARSLPRDQALAELARRYFRSRGPATVADFTWWSGLPPADARAGLAAIEAELISEVAGGRTLWSEAAPPRPARATTHLLPAFDEFLIAYQDRGDVLDPKQARRLNAGGGMLSPCLVAGGQVAGTWRRELSRTAVTVALAPFAPPDKAGRAAIEAAVERYRTFLGLDAAIDWGR